jgi:hypothetical protein
MPAPVRWARALLVLVAVSHVVVPVVLWARQDALRDQIAAAHPEFGAAEVVTSVDAAVVSGVVFHIALLLLCGFLVLALPTARPRIRWLTTVSQLLLVALLWIPRPARDFFVPGSAEQQRAGAVGRAGGDLR